MNLFYRKRISDEVDRVDAKASQAQSDIGFAQQDIRFLQSNIERLLMITEALWGILKEQHGYSDEELVKRVSEIDMRDGALDGRVVIGESPVCPECNRSHIARNRTFCLYCGARIINDPFDR